MARIAGVDLPQNKRIEIALTYIHGIGLTSSRKILSITNVKPDKRVKDLNDNEVKIITGIVDQDFTVEGELRQVVQKNIRRLQSIRCNRGIRHKRRLPVRGQNTRTNCRTRKGKNLAVGGLNQPISKK